VRAAEIYAELRTNVINNVFSVRSILSSLCCRRAEADLVVSAEQEYERTGTVWEQYDAVTGEGKRRWVLRSSSQ